MTGPPKPRAAGTEFVTDDTPFWKRKALEQMTPAEWDEEQRSAARGPS